MRGVVIAGWGVSSETVKQHSLLTRCHGGHCNHGLRLKTSFTASIIVELRPTDIDGKQYGCEASCRLW